MDLALNNLQRLICHKTQQTKPNRKSINESYLILKMKKKLPTAIQDTFFLGAVGVLPLCRGYSPNILSSIDRAECNRGMT